MISDSTRSQCNSSFYCTLPTALVGGILKPAATSLTTEVPARLHAISTTRGRTAYLDAMGVLLRVIFIFGVLDHFICATMKIQFDDATIQGIFGHEAAEDENVGRLREYYFKSQAYNRITADLPLRILVGHKGIGKSALFTVAMQEDRERGILAIIIRPDDVLEISTEQTDLLRSIRSWKTGLLRIIFDKAINALGIKDPKPLKKTVASAAKLLSSLCDALKPSIDGKYDLDPAKKAIVQTLLKKTQVNVYLDDLDRGWTGDRNGISRMSALLNALRDLSKDAEGLRFRVALRSDVYFLVRTSDESTDKIEGSVVWQTWTNHEILALLVKRVESFFGRPVNERDLMAKRQSDIAFKLDAIIDPIFNGRGHWEKCPTYRVLMSLVRRRPRDLVKLCTLAAQHAKEAGSSRIGTSDWTAVFEQYSQGRLQDTTNEFRSELPAIERLLLGMKPNRKEHQAKLGYVYTTATLLQKIENIQQAGPFQFFTGRVANPKDLQQFLYKINFLTARKEMPDGLILRKYFEENKYLSSTVADFGFDWEVHPAYRWALQPEDPMTILSALRPSADDELTSAAPD